MLHSSITSLSRHAESYFHCAFCRVRWCPQLVPKNQGPHRSMQLVSLVWSNESEQLQRLDDRFPHRKSSHAATGGITVIVQSICIEHRAQQSPKWSLLLDTAQNTEFSCKCHLRNSSVLRYHPGPQPTDRSRSLGSSSSSSRSRSRSRSSSGSGSGSGSSTSRRSSSSRRRRRSSSSSSIVLVLVLVLVLLLVVAVVVVGR